MSFGPTPSFERTFPLSSHTIRERCISPEIGVGLFVVETRVARVTRVGIVYTMYPAIIFAWVVFISLLLKNLLRCFFRLLLLLLLLRLVPR